MHMLFKLKMAKSKLNPQNFKLLKIKEKTHLFFDHL